MEGMEKMAHLIHECPEIVQEDDQHSVLSDAQSRPAAGHESAGNRTRSDNAAKIERLRPGWPNRLRLPTLIT